MRTIFLSFLITITTFSLSSQISSPLPEDFRQHNLNGYLGSLFNPTMSMDLNEPRSLFMWNRWQWQTPDMDPTTTFVNHTHLLNSKTAFGVGFMQNNTGLLRNTGGIANVARTFNIGSEGDNLKLILGLNLGFFTQELVNAPLALSRGLDVTRLTAQNSFTFQATPGIRLVSNGIHVGFAFENAFETFITDNGSPKAPQVLSGLLAYDYKFNFLGKPSVFRPMAYVRDIPDFDTQYGVTARVESPAVWIQGGYNSYYGVSGGLGGTFFKKFTIGALAEFGMEDLVKDEDFTVELIVGYKFENQRSKKDQEEEDKKRMAEEESERARLAEEERQRALEQQEKDRIRLEEEQRMLAAKRDSLDLIAKRQALKERELDSLSRIRVQPLPNERYEEDNLSAYGSEEGVVPGFYLVANVFATQKYYLLFLDKLNAQGLTPGSFKRPKNNFNYVYLERFETMQEARDARNSKYYGRYKGETWILGIRR